ncbi:MAG: hypothetical protein ACRDGQ_07200, partial [Candidatus Limnocylindrales bacterium]
MDRHRRTVLLGSVVTLALIAACAPLTVGPTATPATPAAQALAQPADHTFGPAISATSTDRPIPLITPRPPASARPGASASPKPSPKPTAKPTAKPTTRPVAILPLSHCQIFPASNPWNRAVDGLPVGADSAAMIAAIGLNTGLHPDFGSYAGYGIPYNVVGTSTPRSSVTFQYSSESDHVGYPIPAKPRIEAGSDRHLLMVDTNACRLYELYDATFSGGHWQAGSGATWNLASNALRPAGWTSADAAGLPILPGLARYDQDAAGAIVHALRFTAPKSCAGYVAPARHEAGSGSCSVEPPMGLRVRLKASVDISGFPAQTRVILQALKTYGMILADNGSP